MSFIEDANILSETQTDSAGGGLPNWLVGAADMLTMNDKGKVVTSALVSFDLVKDPVKLQQIYDQNKSILNDYFNQIDLQKVNKQFGGKAKPALKATIKNIALNNMPGVLIGLGLGALVGGFFLRHNPGAFDGIMERFND